MAMNVQFDEVFEHVMMNAVIAACEGNGVLDGLAVSERGAGANMSVDVAAGNCMIDGTKYTESSTVNLAISAADATYDRKDLVTYDSNTSNPIVTTGTAAATPEPPDIPSGNILLAIIDVTAGATQITNADITDGIVITLESWYDADTVDGYDAGNSSGQVAVSNGTVCTNLNADTVDGYHAGNSSGQVAVSNGTLCTNLNADKVDGCDAGAAAGNVLKVPDYTSGYILYSHTGFGTNWLAPGTDGYQLTTHGASANPTWSAASDLIFSDTHCPKCGKRFETGDTLVLYVVGHNEVGDTLTIPMHKDCAEAPKKTVTIKRKVFEDRHILDELTGKTKIQRVQKTQKKTVTKHKLKEGYELDHKTGKAIKINKDGSKDETQYDLSIALETVEETIDEPVYEDVEYEI